MLSLARHSKRSSWRGFTLVELIVAITILLILTGAALPIARVRLKREKERAVARTSRNQARVASAPIASSARPRT